MSNVKFAYMQETQATEQYGEWSKSSKHFYLLKQDEQSDTFRGPAASF